MADGGGEAPECSFQPRGEALEPASGKAVRDVKEALVKLHISVFLAGFTGIFGKLITLNDGLLVWWRLLMVCAVMGAYLRLRRQLRLPSFRRTMALWGVGALQCTHWVLFYASIRLSNVSVALVCISLMGFFSAVLSPIILGAKWSAKEFVFSGITIAGIALIFHFDTHYRLGITVGVVSSLVASLFVVCNKKVTGTLPAVEMFFHEMVGGLLYLTLLMPAYLRVFPPASLTPTGSDAVYLLLLAILCTVVLYILQLQALELVSAFTVNLSLNLEPVYAIILAALFLGEAEEFTVSFYLGLSLIILSVALQTVSIMRERKAENALAPS